METTHCNASETLKKVGLSITTQRIAVLEMLIRADRPLNAREILEQTGADLKINRVTVYRILASFRKGGIIREIEAGQGMCRYEMACLHNPIHPHFRCRRCNCIICMLPLTLSQAWEWFVRPYDFSVEGVDIQLTGLCGRCRKEDNSNKVASDGNLRP
jgi:Fe2+ or Zn2+ uptake regulation protein